ncbi:MAG: GLUG motif-containing protein [Lentisphaeria bacterium]
MNRHGLRLAVWVCFGLGLCGWGQPPDVAVVPGGTGTETDPYRISELGHLAWMSNMAADSAGHYYTLSNDIDATATKEWNNGAGFTPIGTESVPFAGVFDGNGHVIRNLTINRPQKSTVGLFGVLGLYSELRNLGIEGAKMAGSWAVGGLVGENYGTITTCYVAGIVNGVEAVGGGIGYNGGTITQCYATAAVTGSDIGRGVTVENNLLTQCRSTSIATSSDNIMTFEIWYGSAGGLVGFNKGIVAECYATGTVTASDVAGGLIGEGYAGTVSQSYWDLETTGQTTSFGGGTGVDTAGMKQAATFAGWDWSVWGIVADGGSYPYLRWNPPPFRVQILTTGPGTVVFEGGLDGTTLTVTAIANDNAEFIRWEGNGIADLTASSTMVILDSHKSIRAVFNTARGISNITELQKIGNDPAYPSNGHYWLTQDFDAAETATWNNGAGFAPIGTTETPFTGVFDGNGHVIRNLTINRPQEELVGLFGTVGKGGKLCNLALENDVVTGVKYVGALIGHNDGMVNQCCAAGTVNGEVAAGGLVGENNGAITQSYATGTVNGLVDVGGLVGENNHGIITQCYAAGTITGSDCVGGLVGNSNYSTITQCYATSIVTGSWGVGGLVGYSFDNAISQAYWDIEATGLATSSGDGTGMATASMKQATTFAGWDWGVWGIVADGGSYPYLRWDPPPFHVQVLGTGPGTVKSQSNPEGKTITVTAIADSIAEFVRWEGCGIADPAAASTTVTLDINKSVRAIFRTARGISTIEELQKIGNDPSYTRDGRYWLTQDLDASETATWHDGAGFVPVGTTTAPFIGVFDGNGHVIRNLTINLTIEDNAGLFGTLGGGGELRNLGVEGVEVAGAEYVGALIGNSFGTVSKCHATGTVTGSDYIGALIGCNGGSVIQCYATGAVNGYWSVGGLVGNNNGSITQCYATGTVNAGTRTGGLIGYNGGTVTRCHATGTVNGYWSVGGVVGNNGNTLIQCYATGIVTGDQSVGGVVGYNTGAVTRCCATGNIANPTASSVGGVVGTNEYSGMVTQCYAIGSVAGDANVGGLLGYNDGTVAQCYATGTAVGIAYVGGLVALNNGTINQCYAIGTVTAKEYASGGLLGANASTGTVSQCYATGAVIAQENAGGLMGDNYGSVTQSYWDITSTHQATSGGGTGVGTAKMKHAATFAGWDWGTVWGIAENVGYPYLQANIHTVSVGPDFVVTNLVITPELPAAGGKITVAVTVANLDSKPGKGGTLQVWADKPAAVAGGEKGNKAAAISTLKPGQSKTVKVTLTAPNTLGTFTLRAFVDAQNATTETDETNNQATLSYRTGRPDFTVKSVSLNLATPAAGKTFTAYVTVANAGEVAGDAGSLDAWADCSALAAAPVPGGKTRGNKSKTIGKLQPGQEKTVTITGLKAPAANPGPILGLLIDSRAKTVELDENNNWFDFGYRCP